ncbi:MAG TPA: sigma-70 family RNA polymerase sigma factor [Acidimicrobiales bacterium]|nr:sigma-70 family RNA polymerase sigma factor [Acidimicrobiales bacterium]
MLFTIERATEIRNLMAKSSSGTPDSIRLFLDDLDRYPLPDHNEQVELAKAVAAGDDEARRRMIAANLRLVIHWARRYQDRGVDFTDLVQEGTFGLMRAVDKFDWQRGFKFSTYATWWIRQALQRAVQQHGNTIRVPMEVAEQAQRVDRTTWELSSEMRREPTPEEIAEASGLDVESLNDLAQAARVVASLDQPAGADSNTPLGDLVGADEHAAFEDQIERRLVLDGVREAVDDLDELERNVVRLRFGLDGSGPTSLQATAARLGIGVRRARQAEARALQRLAAVPAVEAAHRAA